MADVRIDVDPSVLGYAVRYAVGRQTFAVQDVCGALVEHAGRLTGHQRTEILGDLRDGHRHASAGFAPHWQRAIDALEVPVHG